MDNQKNMNKKTVVSVIAILAIALLAGWFINNQNQEAASIKSQAPSREITSQTTTSTTTSSESTSISPSTDPSRGGGPGEVTPAPTNPPVSAVIINATTRPASQTLANINTTTGMGTLALTFNGSFTSNTVIPLTRSFKWGNSAALANPVLVVSGTTTASAGNFSYSLIASNWNPSTLYYQACVTDTGGNQYCGATMTAVIVGTSSCAYIAGYPVPPCLGKPSNIPKPPSPNPMTNVQDITQYN